MSGSFCANARKDPSKSRQLLVILILIGPVLAFERPVLLVVSNQPLGMKPAKHLGWKPPFGQISDLDLQLLLLADDGVDLAQARLAQQVAQAALQLEKRVVAERGRGIHEARAKLVRLARELACAARFLGEGDVLGR